MFSSRQSRVAVIKPLFAKGPSLGVRLLVLVVLSAVLMVVDARFEVLQPLRSQLGLIVEPTYRVARLPMTLWEEATQQIASRSELVAAGEKTGLSEFLQGTLVLRTGVRRSETRRPAEWEPTRAGRHRVLSVSKP